MQDDLLTGARDVNGDKDLFFIISHISFHISHVIHFRVIRVFSLIRGSGLVCPTKALHEIRKAHEINDK